MIPSQIRHWAKNHKKQISKYGLSAVKVGIKDVAWRGPISLFNKTIYDFGTPIFDLEWDVLVVLDACRVDLLQAVADDYEFLPDNINHVNSVASATYEWMPKNFNDEYRGEMSKTAHITANPYSSEFLEGQDWLVLRELWRQHTTDINTVPPDVVTDHAISTHRSLHPEQMIIHYLQPHEPFRKFDSVEDEWFQGVWDQVRHGKLSPETVREAYQDNLCWVLDELNTLLKNIDGEVVITSDHGNAMGEWGFWGHPAYVPIPELRRVPWVEIEAEDMQTYTPDVLSEDEKNEKVDREELLESLGYR